MRGLPFFLRISRIVVTNFMVFLVLLVPVELIFGGWVTSEGDISKLNVRPNTLDVQSSPLYPPGRKITYSRNEYGFRGNHRPAGSIGVLAIGGSTTNERFVDDADTWTARLEKLLRENNCPIVISNAGIDGYSTAGNIASFNGWFNRIPGLRPRFILVYTGLNDAALAPSAELAAVDQKFDTAWRRIEHYVAGNSAIRRLYVGLRGWWNARAANLLHGELPVASQAVWEPAILPLAFETEIAPKANAYHARLERLTKLIRDFGSQPIYITQRRMDGRVVDGRWQQIAGSNGAKDAATLAVINRTTLSFCLQSDQICIDLGSTLSFEPGDFYDAVHTTPAGSARIADFLARVLTPILCHNRANLPSLRRGQIA
jgi:hypothetical protein